MTEGDNGKDVLRGSNGDDHLAGRAGPDRLFGGPGQDRIFGGVGHDRLLGGEGVDRLFGGRGDDVIFGYGWADKFARSANITVTGVAHDTFSRPVFTTSAPGDPDRLYVVEQHTGRIRVLEAGTGETSTTPFLDLPDARLATGNEQGLLGLAFDPDYADNGRLFVYLTRANGDAELRSYRRSSVDPEAVDPDSGDTLLVLDRDNGASNHNGGWIGFGPDGLLYVAIGDEGLAGDPDNNAQDPDELWGKLLRIDVDGDDFPADPDRDYAIPDGNPFVGRAGADGVWALGLRNPWRNSFDRKTGDLYIGDVGQGEREEIDFQRAGSNGGANYGWKVKEGEIVFDDSVPGNPDPDSPALIDPVVSYPHDASGGFAVIGGYVYRGEAVGMQGRYLYADFASEQLWSLRMVGDKAVDVTNHTAQLIEKGGSLAGITSFAEDGRGNLYAVGIGGTISRLQFGDASGDARDILRGGPGNDRLYGGAGSDLVAGGQGRDILHGGGQNDHLTGGPGADRIAGNGGADFIGGGSGADLLIGGGGADLFFFGPGSGSDTIADFTDDVDTIRFAHAFGLGSAAEALDLAKERGDDVVFSFQDGQTLTVRETQLSALADDLLV